MSSSFSRFVCWKAENARSLTDPEALRLSDAAFEAVHLPMKVQQRVGHGAQQLYSEVAFLEDLLDAKASFRLVPVIGPSGTGKSHLIRWLASRATRMDDGVSRRVILVPRALTNLRDVIGLLLSAVGEETAAPYRLQLAGAAEPTSDEAGRARLLSELILAVEHEAQRPTDAYSRSAQRGLPPLLKDPHLQQAHWLRPGGVIERLYDRALGRARPEDEVGQPEFGESDLPLTIADIGYASQQAKVFLPSLRREDIRRAILAELNRHIDPAIQRLLNFRGTDLLALLRDLRRDLSESRTELVLFIEDVARLQGLDAALLEAVQEQPSAVLGTESCALRVVLGTTNGFYDASVPESLKQRASYEVWLEEGSGLDMIPLAARYLNAARLGDERLLRWYAESEGAEHPNACTTCPFLQPCHAAFGAHNGIGLYPFTERALKTMYSRLKTEQAEGFIPRVLLRDVLFPMLVTEEATFRDGASPSPQLHAHFGGKKGWAPLDEQRVLANSDGRRVLTLFDLWGGVGKPVRLESQIYEAFDIPMPSLGDGAFEPAVPVPLPVQVVEGSDPVHESLPVDPLFQALTQWSNGNSLDQSATRELRKLVFAHVVARIDWNAIFIIESVGKDFFRDTSLYFEGQTLGRGQAPVQLSLPLKGWNRSDTALALQGLVLSERTGSWGFDNGKEHFVAWARLVGSISHVVVGELERLGSTRSWSPAVAAAELLQLGARLHGLPLVSQTNDVARQAAFYKKWDSDDPGATREWRMLQASFEEKQSSLQNILESFGLSTKGNSSGTKTLDTARWYSVLRRRKEVVAAHVPDQPPTALQDLKSLRASIAQRLPLALKRENERWAQWHALTGAAIQPDETLGEVSTQVESAIDQLRRAGQLQASASTFSAWEMACGQINGNRFEALRSQLRDIDADVDATEDVDAPTNAPEATNSWDSSQLRRIGRLSRLGKTAEVLASYARQTRALLAPSVQHLERVLAAHGDSAGAEEAWVRVRDALNAWDAFLKGESRHPMVLKDARLAGAVPLVTEEVPRELSAQALEGPNSMPLSALAAYAVELSKRADRLGRMQGLADRLQRWAEELEGDSAAWAALEQSRDVMLKGGIEMPASWPTDSILSILELLLQASEDAELLVGPTLAEQRNLFKRLRGHHYQQRKEEATRAWEDYVDAALPSRRESLLSIFGKMSTVSKLVSEYRTVLALALKLRGSLPQPGDIEAIAAHAQRMNDLWTQIVGEGDLPPDVHEFLRYAGGEGAPLSTFNHEVQAWIHERRLEGEFRIRIRQF